MTKRYKVVKYQSIIIICLLFIFLLVSQSFAGGLHVHKDDVRFNGYPPGSSFYQNQRIVMSYTADDYSYSGGHEEFEYFIFFITKPYQIRGSVGEWGKNSHNDVKIVQNQLYELNYYEGAINGKCNEQLITSIKKFQQNIGLRKPDGRIDPNSFTSKRLLKFDNPTIFIQLARIFSEYGRRRPIRYEVEFTAPIQPGSYELKYCRWPLFTNYAFGRLDYDSNYRKIRLSSSEERRIKEYINKQSHYDMVTLSEIEIVGNKSEYPELKIYLRVNDTVPGIVPRINPGIYNASAKFSWWVKKSSVVEDVHFRYKLYPDDKEWSLWDSSKEANYFFINTGQHEFRVEGRYIDETGIEKRTPQVNYSFTLSDPFISKPIIKADSRRIARQNASSIPDKLYSKSSALLIGITNFEDNNFAQLPYIDKDLNALESALRRNKFEVKKLMGKIKREQILNAIENIILSSNENDRIIIYFSTHGFQDEYVKSTGYIACSDCYKNRPTTNCIDINYLETIIKRGIKKPIKHILIIIDSCFSGLGIITKNTKYPDIARIATKQGAHMMTAGMAEQEAQMDHQLRMSTFTHFLKQGLLGDADYTEDKIITLTELLLFVQYEVARKTHAAQIPMLGRISGQGEMIFDRR